MSKPDLTARLAAVRRREVALPEDLVSTSPLAAGGELPLLVEPAVAGLDLAEWAAARRGFVDGLLHRHGALLCRGFAVDGAAAFERVAAGFCRELYGENSEHRPIAPESPIQTPVSYAPARKLLWHNENSFNLSWPGKLLFYCDVPAATGGETPIADSRRVHARLDPALRSPFEERGVMYVRNYYRELGLDWQTVFRTDSKAEVEARCRAEGLEQEWKPGDRLRTRAVRPAVARHPVTGEVSWFNQAQHWHPSCLDPDTRESLAAILGAADLPRSCAYGDGTPIPDEVMAEILAVYAELEVSFPWRRGDLLVVDNVLTAHARNPYSGERRILVALGEMASLQEKA